MSQQAPSLTPTPEVKQKRIAMRAYEKWCQRGCPQGTDQCDWLEAEAEIEAEFAQMNTQAPPTPRRRGK